MTAQTQSFDLLPSALVPIGNVNTDDLSIATLTIVRLPLFARVSKYYGGILLVPDDGYAHFHKLPGT